jgi:hypothetical protein
MCGLDIGTDTRDGLGLGPGVSETREFHELQLAMFKSTLGLVEIPFDNLDLRRLLFEGFNNFCQGPVVYLCSQLEVHLSSVWSKQCDGGGPRAAVQAR